MQQRLQKKSQSSNKLDKQILVEDIFSKISNKYDFMNDLMSLGLHRLWKKELVDLMNLNKNEIVLDLASGSGDLIKLLKNKYNCRCVGYDSSLNMLKTSMRKITLENVFLVNGRAEKMPFKTRSFDAVTASFGVRNFSDVEQAFSEIKRVLKYEGKFYCLEFSQINNPYLRKVFSFYSRIIPFYGKLFLKNEKAYTYLVNSIKEFPNQIQLTKKLLKAGFKNVEVIDILDGLASIHISEL